MTNRRRARAAAALAALTLPAASLVVIAPAADAATATVPNGIATTDLATPGLTPATLAQDLAGTGVTVSNVAFTGAWAQAGRVHLADPAIVAFNDAVILSSGDVANVVGPNSSDGITGDMAASPGAGTPGAGDPDLTNLIKDTQTVNPMTYDATSLEFDFTPAANQVYFTYTFGSDEYLEWVNLFNDVFAFLVTDANGHTTNCATVPVNQPVSIDTINDVVNPTLFRDNAFSAPPANPLNIEMDGLSVELICTAPVTAGKVNHMKLAIADTSDQILDSVVMIKSGTLSTTKPESCNDGVDNDDDTLVDMTDDYCTTTTTPAPTGQSGVGTGSSAPPFTGVEGTPITLDASALGWTGPTTATSAKWTVTGINGTAGSCEVTPATQPMSGGVIPIATALCPSEGEYAARYEAFDGSDSQDDRDVDFFVHNAPPAVTIDSPSNGQTVDTGATVGLAATATDPGTGDQVTCDVSWGDGTGTSGVPTDANGVCAATHTYAAAGDYIVSVTGTDGVDSTATAVLLSVTDPTPPPNVPPTVDAGPAATGVEGSSVSLAGTAADPDGDPVSVTWSVSVDAADPGTACTMADPGSLSTTVTCTDDAAFTATLTASDGVNSPVTSSTTGVVGNANPTVFITQPAVGTSVDQGATLMLKATLTDVGANDTLGCSIAWGDGSSSAGTVAAGACTGSHAYGTDGLFTVTVNATDDDGGAGTSTRSVTVVKPAVVVHTATGSGSVGDMTFSFNVTGSTPPTGALSTKRTVKGYVLVAKTVDTTAWSGTQFSWTGTGTWNGKSGYRYSATATDNGASGDVFTVTVTQTTTNRKGQTTTTTVFTRTGSVSPGGLTVN